MTTSSLSSVEKEEGGGGAVWDPDLQMYVGNFAGKLNDNDDKVVNEYIMSANPLRIFGYGSLCWNPGSDGVLSHPNVTARRGKAIGYKRCWAQRTTDHRGTPSFPGIVCTLLKESEYLNIVTTDNNNHTKNDNNNKEQDASLKSMVVEGLVYSIPEELKQECLEELDIRELTGAYARDVTDIIDSETGETIQALVYRGTPVNPNFSKRALLDFRYAAAIMAISVGPSGPNDEYLNNLNMFMMNSTTSKEEEVSSSSNYYRDDTDTALLTTMVQKLQQPNKKLFFMIGCGSNQHDQLLLNSDTYNGAELRNNGEDAYEMKDVVLCIDTNDDDYNKNHEQLQVKQIAAGAGHSALVTQNGNLYLWGWNDEYQCGRDNTNNGEINDSNDGCPLPITPKLNIDFKVHKVALGFSHTLLLSEEGRKLYAFGSNERGQVVDNISSSVNNKKVVTPTLRFPEKTFVDISAGLFHSAAITTDGYLVTFGCDRFGQVLSRNDNNGNAATFWKPSDGSHLMKVACGRRHTIILDEYGRIWTFGDNKYGQLGRSTTIAEGKKNRSNIPTLMNGKFGKKGSGCIDITCGWSHCIATCVKENNNNKANSNNTTILSAYGWGRNDKGQLGSMMNNDNNETIITTPIPIRIPNNTKIHSVACGSESTIMVDTDGKVWGCGWNEHGNIGLGHNDKDIMFMTQIPNARIPIPPSASSLSDNDKNVDTILLAAGGAHVLLMRKQ